MGYTSQFTELSRIFNPGTSEIYNFATGVKATNIDFKSEGIPEDLYCENDQTIGENNAFKYPVFIPEGPLPARLILLFHGLNERTWNKYLAWAFVMASETKSIVILFPISFHINRSPVSWRDPRAMLNFLKERISKREEIRSSCFANVALSNRLSDDPRRFLKSGYQTVCDVVKLMKQIRSGKHPIIPEGSRVNIFAYSIGAFLAEIIMMANPENLFSDSLLFMFCGGSVFSNMRGESKLIMDSMAYERVYNYYMQHFEEELVYKKNSLSRLVNGSIGMAFRSMIDISRFKDHRERELRRIGQQIFSVSLAHDKVIPQEGIRRTLNPSGKLLSCRLESINPEYPYSHENPFPVLNNKYASDVDRSFEHLFTSVADFLR
jgi:hypothetical protein